MLSLVRKKIAAHGKVLATYIAHIAIDAVMKSADMVLNTSRLHSLKLAIGRIGTLEHLAIVSSVVDIHRSIVLGGEAAHGTSQWYVGPVCALV